MSEFLVKPIGHVFTPFRERFGIPRQSGLVPSARGEIYLSPHPHLKEMLLGLESFSHIWIIFQFHEANAKKQKTHDFKISVRPPRLGGMKKMGILATRSPHHPNQLGLSVVKLEGVHLPKTPKDYAVLEVSGVDLLDGSPVVDIKPYLPYADAISTASSGWTIELEDRLTVNWNSEALTQLEELVSAGACTSVRNQKRPPQFSARTSDLDFKSIRQLIEEVVSLDPRPASQKKKNVGEDYAFTVYHLDVHWRPAGQKSVLVTMVRSLGPTYRTK